VPDEVSALEGYRWLTEVLGVALDCYLHADAAHPAFVRLVSPTRKFGGDNADAVYHFAPLDPARTYRVRGRMGDAVYLSLCVYGGPNDGRWSNRIVGSLHDRELAIGPDRSFEVWLAPERPPGAGSAPPSGSSSAQPSGSSRAQPSGSSGWLRLDPDAVCVVTRDYLIDPVRGRQADWSIEAVPPAPAPALLTDPELARRLRCTASFLRDLLNICPLPPIGEPNAVAEPYRQQAAAYGWAAPDVVYAMGRYDLADDEALVLEGRAPACAFWNLCLWNPFLQTYDYRHHRVTINGGQIALEPDGSWRVVISARDPGHPNWLTTAGHPRGVLWFRWFLADETPARPTARVVKV